LRKTSGINAISSDNKRNWIIDNISVDGNGTGSYGTHGIYVTNTNNSSINNVDVYKNYI